MAVFVKKCPCLRPQIEEDVRVLDYRHCSLTDVPGEVFNFERTLEELLVDSNQIKDLPRELFYCHGIRKLSISDNEIKTIPAAIASLISLEKFDLSKNGVIDIPENIKCCKYLQIVDASVNPLGKLPDGFTQLLNLTQLYLNDTFLDYLPGNFGRLSHLKTLEIRENHLKTLPKSFSRLTELEKLDIGHNEFMELPDVIGSLCNLLELWCDHNQITTITPTIGNLKNLMFLDGCKNQIQTLPSEIEGCSSLADLHLTTNRIQALPDSIGNLSYLTTLKVDDNQLTAVPDTIGGLESLSELNVSANDLQDLPASLGLLRYLRTFYADENLLEFIPAEMGSCSGITVLSLRGNRLTYIPDEIGRIPRLRVLNLSANELKYLPFTFIKLKELQALWLSENQTRPLIPLQSEHDPDTGRKILTCYLLPQGPPQDSGDVGGDTDSFHASMWEEERHNRQKIHFEFGDDSDVDGQLVRQPTPYPKEMREKQRHVKNLALLQAMSNGSSDPRAAQGEDNPAYLERKHNQMSPSSEKRHLLAGASEGLDVRMREARITKPISPSLQDTHRLYRYEKEKFAKDKARMQHRHLSQGEEEMTWSPRRHSATEPSPVMSARGGRQAEASRKGREKRNEDCDDGGFRERGQQRVTSLGSTPDIPSTTEERPSPRLNRFTYCSPSELSSSVSQRSGHSSQHRSHRHRKMRDYDSDTGYRSDQELLMFRKQQEQMFTRMEISSRGDNHSEIVRVVQRKGKRRDGYSSDLEAYSKRNSGAVYSTETSVGQQQQQTQQQQQPQPPYSSTSLPYGLNSNQSQSNPSQTQVSQNDTVRSDEFYEQKMGDSLMEKSRYPPSSPSPFHRNKIVNQSTPMSPSAQGYHCSAGQTSSQPSPNNKAERPFEWKKDLFHAGSQQESESDRYMIQTGGGERPALPPYKPAPPYIPSPSQRKLPPTPHRTSPYGGSNSDRQTRGSPTKEYQRMPEIQEYNSEAGSRTDLSRSRSEIGYQQTDSDGKGYRNSEGARGNYSDVYKESQGTPRSQGANISRTSASFGYADVTSASSKDSGNYSYREQTSMGESPVNHFEDRSSARNSPMSGLPDRASARNSPFDYAKDHHSSFDKYDNSFRQPPTVDIPTKYDDIAIFKGSEPPSQVSSSTDSGYAYGHNVYEKAMDGQRFSNGNASQSSPSPDQFHSDSTYNSSSLRESGQFSRGATPVNHAELKQENNNGYKDPRKIDRFRVTITKNPGLGFSIAGGLGSYGNPYRRGDMGIFVTKVQPEGPAASSVKPGDKLLEVNGLDFSKIDHDRAVTVLKSTGNTVSLYMERDPS